MVGPGASKARASIGMNRGEPERASVSTGSFEVWASGWWSLHLLSTLLCWAKGSGVCFPLIPSDESILVFERLLLPEYVSNDILPFSH